MTFTDSFLPGIQGLRAIAVALVVIFHIQPSFLSGGYVGVDVFFVISGYLITSMLAREAERSGRISLLDFYGRRIRRLLPAATLVLIASAIGTLLILPSPRWDAATLEIAASALYVENWVLAWLTVDYLGAENAASPVQHYWSLSIEEQFYLIWPVLICAIIYISSRVKWPLRSLLLAALSCVFGASLAASILITQAQPEQAYFFTHTRIWELALGGLLALRRIPQPQSLYIRVPVIFVGLSAIIYVAVTYDIETAFPGYAALLPTAATALLIWAGDFRIGGFAFLGNRILQYIGDRSYSIYLWHWPLIVFYAYDRESVGPFEGLLLVVATLWLSHLSYEFVETRYRHQRRFADRKPLAYGVASIAACLITAGSIQGWISVNAGTQVTGYDPEYPGPAALVDGAPVPDGMPLIPDLSTLKRDLPVVYSEDCHQNQQDSEPVYCTLGDPKGSRVMAITGDSHAAQWVPALEQFAEKNSWRLLTFTKSACPFSRMEVQRSGEPYPSCAEWRENVLELLPKFSVQALFTSQSRYGYHDRKFVASANRDLWEDVLEEGIDIIAIADTPWMNFSPGDCLSDDKPCQTARREAAVQVDPLKLAAEDLDNVQMVDMIDHICEQEWCNAVVGNIIVWRDKHHLTATYARALTPYLFDRVTLPKQVIVSIETTENFERFSRESNSVKAQLFCDKAVGSPSFAREIELELEEGRITLRRGDWQDKQDNFDLWKGTINDTTVRIKGEYREGPGGIKDVKFSGQIKESKINLEGKRGPRQCQVEESDKTQNF